MKRTILILTAILAVNAASAQFFVKAGLGYNFSAVTAPYVAENLDDSAQYVSSNAFTHSFGNGAQLQGALGYDFNENLGFQIGVGYGLTSEALEYSETASGGYVNARSIKSKGVLMLMPAFTLSSNADRLNLYSRVGLTLPVAGKVHNDVVRTSPTQQFDNKTELTGKLTLGYNAAFGMSFPLSDKLTLWAELNGNFINVNADELTVTSIYDKTNNKELLDTRTVQQNSRIYVDEVFATDNQNTAEPMKVLSDVIPFSSVGVAVGVKFSFGNSREARREGDK